MADTLFETARLRLRNWDEADIRPFMERVNTPGVMRWLGGVQDEAAFRDAYERLQGFQRDYGHTFWIVERREDDEMLGFCGLKRTNAPESSFVGDFEIGWRFAESAQGQGYAREAAERALQAAFETYDAPHVVALTVVQNEPSWRLMEKLGMERRPDLDFVDARWGPDICNTIVYAITREAWTKRGRAR